MRLAAWNVAWFDALFDDAGGLLADDGPGGFAGARRGAQAAAVAEVLAALDADALVVIEAPDARPGRAGLRALERFAAAAGIRARKALVGFVNGTQQEIALLYDPVRLTARHDPQASEEAPRFDGRFRIDLDIDGRADTVQFSKPPLEVAVTPAAGRPFRLIGVHLKSKAPRGARGSDAMKRVALAARRKQLAQAVWLRRRIDAVLAAGEELVVAGDLNDGPGLDELEALFGRSSVEIVMGGDGQVPLFDPHAHEALTRRIGAQRNTARFWVEPEGRWLSALLDYIMVSPGLMAARPAWRIWHPFEDPACWGDPALRAALVAASDHYPVTLDLDLGG
ncbi:endonuclease/exonuclease/phosphatase family protein [Rhodosalinus sp.]|uniref:endonuclease/exonuclease/phosphatase family protein n=1 Tax=Rhodosalinus sp. TaxID=2047741 RepID=UPI00397B4AA2